MARHLLDLGLSAPAILAADETAGLVLLEDFGDDTFTRLLKPVTDEAALYRLAIDVLDLPASAETGGGAAGRAANVRHRTAPGRSSPPPDWHMPAASAGPPTEDARRAYIAAWEEVLTPVLSLPATLVLRDFHVDNLMRLSERDGLKACGLLDFQDAVAGPAAYDVMSLLEDARRDVSPALRRRCWPAIPQASAMPIGPLRTRVRGAGGAAARQGDRHLHSPIAAGWQALLSRLTSHASGGCSSERWRMTLWLRWQRGSIGTCRGRLGGALPPNPT